MILEAFFRLLPENVVLEPLAVVGAVRRSVVDLSGLDGDFGGEARAQLVSHNQDQVGVRDHLDTERPKKKSMESFYLYYICT